MHDLGALKAFDALYRYGSLTAAAERLAQPKSTLSRRLSQLEADLGQSLVVRQGNRLQLTEAGQLFSVYCRQILEVASQGQEALESLTESISGELLVVADQVFLRSWLVREANAFLARYPGLRMHIQGHATPATLEQADVMIWLGPPPIEHWRHERLALWSFGFYTSSTYRLQHGVPEHPRELLQHQWVDMIGMVKEGLDVYHPDALACTLPPFDSRITSDTVVLQVDAICRGEGIGLLPVHMAEGYLSVHPGELEACLPGWHPAPVEVGMFYSPGRPSRKLQALLKHLRAHPPQGV
ncbi:hypothetical protein BFW38_13340 [Terasakiispira papahanaumokuakeensis]|uniref:HTH lysR-type domain-containing protein n=1 Tax=Terasakiispira papahanaumokuakeensis TaxID=197479 RepID=A0A1E2VBH6_9GAMM|nr:LysR family transcriptional regulator [Terasakiispira papahanaumokuakeensis]ODC04370.1 hypothetical protein BFW38_13340 [Terasakiispira papahanaumokuakeensis]